MSVHFPSLLHNQVEHIIGEVDLVVRRRHDFVDYVREELNVSTRVVLDVVKKREFVTVLLVYDTGKHGFDL